MKLVGVARLLPLVFLVACSQNNKFAPPPPTGGSDGGGGGPGLGGNGDGGASDDGGAVAAIDMSGFNTAGSPVVTITAPASGAEVHGDTLAVTATVTSPTSTLIQSVELTVSPPGAGVKTTPMSLTATANSYGASIDVSAFPSGMATFTVIATDLDGNKGSATGSYLHDHGPVLTFVKPDATQMTAKGTLAVEIVVDDSLHPITSLSQVQAGIRTANDITLTQVAGATPFRVAATVDLVTPYTPPLDGPQIITARATNSAGTVGQAQQQFIVDNAGPTITNVTPVAGAFVGGVVEIKADITDISKVNTATVVAVFGGNAASVPLTQTSGNTFHGFFDVRTLGTSYVLPELSIRADDLLGNHTDYGEEIIVDNTRPWLTMDGTLTMYMGKLDPSNNVECSRPFVPLGPLAAKEGQTVQQLVTVRARIEDHGNTAPGLTVERLSGIDAASVRLYAIPDNGQALAVDTDADGTCDDVNPLLVPTTQVSASGQALALNLVPMKTGGPGPDYRQLTATVPGCAYVGDATSTEPADLCLYADPGFNYVIPFLYGSDPNPAVTSPIFTIAPVDTTDCVGLQLDSLNTLPEGPTCVLTRASDMAGNTSVSQPLHVCIDRGGGLCAGFTPTAAHCTGVFDKASQQVTPGSTCNPPSPTFVDGEVRVIVK